MNHQTTGQKDPAPPLETSRNPAQQQQTGQTF